MSTEPGPASARIAHGLREQILHGALAPGSRIRQAELAAQFCATPCASSRPRGSSGSSRAREPGCRA
jgi:hypothetical protein